MANNIAKFVISGNLITDSELKYTNAGTPVCEFAVASNWSKKQGDTWTDQVSFFNFALFGRRADSLHQYLRKGQGVNVAGDIHQDRWEKNGQKQSRVAFAVSDIQLIGGRSGGSPAGGSPAGGSGGGNGSGGYQGNYQGNHQDNFQGKNGNNEGPLADEIDFEDDIPF
jgi:single-strand DNA-binding protein